MIVFPLYAILVWWITWKLPARWMRLLFIPAAVGLEMLVASYLIYRFPRPDIEPPPIWLMSPAWGYGGLLASVCLLITFAKPHEDHLCHACGYDLAGNELGVCPECGTVARCRNCRHPLVQHDFGDCPHCKEPFPRFLPVSTLTENTAPRPARDSGKLIEKYISHIHENA